MHYVWCAPFFDYNKESALTPRVPYTSNPIDVFRSLRKDILIYDNHKERNEIHRNVIGLLRGANIMYSSGKISKEDYDELQHKIVLCQKDENFREYFRPLIYVIPYALNQTIIKKVPCDKAALTLSSEYIIKSLPRSNFNIIDLGEEGKL